MSTEITPAGDHAVVSPAETPRLIKAKLSRRGLLRVAFWTSLGTLLVGAVATVLNSIYPRGVRGFGGPVAVPPDAIPQPGAAPVKVYEGHFLLVNLEPDEGQISTDKAATSGGLLALWWKCPHLGCTVPWQQDFVFDDGTGRRGWFRCPCHSSTYTKAGVRVFGPAPRSMDTMRLEVDANGQLIVDTGAITKGGADNPSRALPWPPAADTATT